CPSMSLNRLIAEQRRGITLLLDDFIVAEPVHLTVNLVAEVVDLADQRTICVIKSALLWPEFLVRMAKMPFADDSGLVAGLLECLWQQPLVSCEAVGMALRNDRRLQTVSHRIPPRRASSGSHKVGRSVSVATSTPVLRIRNGTYFIPVP